MGCWQSFPRIAAVDNPQLLLLPMSTIAPRHGGLLQNTTKYNRNLAVYCTSPKQPNNGHKFRGRSLFYFGLCWERLYANREPVPIESQNYFQQVPLVWGTTFAFRRGRRSSPEIREGFRNSIPFSMPPPPPVLLHKVRLTPRRPTGK